jgi:hypothetical protein
MAITKIQPKQIKDSTNPGSILASDTSNNFSVVSPSLGADHLWFYDHSATALVPLTVGTNLSITGTTLNASAGAGGYAEVQEEGSALTARTKINFIGTGLTAADDVGNTRTNVTLATFLNTLATQGNVNAATQLTGITPVANGGTGLSSGTSGGILFYSAAGTLASSGALTDNVLVVGGGAGVTPNSLAAGLGTTTTVLHGNAGGEPTWGAVSLTADVTGTLPATNGGTGQVSYAVGDLLSASTTTALSRVAAVATGSVLKSAGVSTLPVWGTLASTELSDTAAIMYLAGTQTVSGTKTFSNNITINGTPSANTDAATVGWVLNNVAGLRSGSVRGATTSILTASAQTATTITLGGTTFTHDGVTYANGETILVKDSVTGGSGGTFNNGPYTVGGVGSSVVLTRVPWMDTAGEVDGVYVMIQDGTTNAGTLWFTVSEVTSLGTDAIAFSQIQTSGTIGGTAAANKVAYGSATNTLTSTSNFHFDGTALTIGGTAAAASSFLTTKGTTTNSSAYGYVHQNSSGTQVFRVANDGTTVVGTGTTLTMNGTGIAGTSNVDITAASGTNINLYNGAGGTTKFGAGYSWTGTAGTDIAMSTSSIVAYPSGTATFTSLALTPSISQIGGANGITRVLHINPTLTTPSDFRALEITASAGYALWTTAGKVRFDIGSDAAFDLHYRASGGERARLANGTTGQFLGANTGAAPSWQTPAGGTITRAYLTGSTSSVIDLDSGTGVTDIDGANITFTVPSDLEKTFVVRNGVLLSRSGTVTRDYTLVSGTGVLTLATALTADESLMVYKIV